MPDSEDRKGLFSVDVVKKTEKVSKNAETDIGVEADIPVEDEIADLGDLSSNLKINESISKPRIEESGVPVREEIKEKKIQVFNISSGKVIERDLLSEAKNYGAVSGGQEGEKTDKTAEPSASPVKRDRTGSAARLPGEKNYNKTLAISGGIVVFLIILYLLFSNVLCAGKNTEQVSTPVINLPK